MVVLTLAPLSARAAGAGIPCTCRYAGEKFSVGDVTCIKTSSGTRLARCDMVLNNTSWTFLQNGCPISRAEPAVNATFFRTVPGLSALRAQGASSS